MPLQPKLSTHRAIAFTATALFIIYYSAASRLYERLRSFCDRLSPLRYRLIQAHAFDNKSTILLYSGVLRTLSYSSAASVKKLCETAMINKTTFYSHYETIEALHHKICGEFVMELLSQCRSIDSIQSEPSVFVVSIFELFAGNMSAIDSNPFKMLFISLLIKLYCNSSQTRCPISARFSRAIEERGR